MPCYCDTPDQENQAEIEKRCKARMYFDAQPLMTDEQIAEASRLKVGRFPMGDVNERLCKLCKILTEEQLKKVSAYYYQIEWSHETLYDWHVAHCKDDIAHNSDEAQS